MVYSKAQSIKLKDANVLALKVFGSPFIVILAPIKNDGIQALYNTLPGVC